MKKLLFLAIVVSCLSYLSAAPVALLSTCSTPSFKAAQSFNVGANCCGNDLGGVAVTDLNNDGRADVVTANGLSNTVSVLLGGGQSFSPVVNFSVGAVRPFSLTVGDFNEDGKADVVTTNVISGNLSIMLGDGAGGFSAVSHVNGATDAIYVSTGDFNGDGNTDLALACSNTASVKVLLGNGAGGFGPFSSFAVGSSPRALVATDFNLDGKTDLAVANSGSNDISVLIGDGTGGFTAQTLFMAGTNPQHLAVGDFNGDGKTDLAVANYGSFSMSVLLGGGDGQFGSPLNLPVGSPVNSVAVGDFNNDGNADLAAGSNAAGVSIRLGDGAGHFGVAKNLGVAFGALYVVVSDFNLDGSDDIIAGSSQSDAVITLVGDGAGNFNTTPSVTTTTNVISTALADFNGDGKLDAVLANENAGSVSVRLGTGSGSFGSATSFNVGTRPYSVSVGDFNNDGRADIVTANYLSANVSVLLGDGAGGFGTATSINLGSFYPSFVTVSDVNKDNKADILVIRDNVFVVTVLLGDGAGGFSSPVNYATAPNPRAVAVGDFNGDGKTDLAVSDNHFSILLGDGAGGFGAPMNTNFGDNTGPKAIVAGDFNNDGKLDLALSNEFTNNVSVLIGDGTGKFAPRVNFRVGTDPSSLAVADFNGDGRPDLVVGNFTSESVSVLLGDGAGGFGQAFNWAIPAHPNAVAIGDLDGDGKTDITAVGSGTLASLLNTCGQDAPPPDARLSVDDVTVAEPDAGTVNAVFTVSLAAASTQTVTTRFIASALNARKGEDFQPVSGTLTFVPGVTTQTVAVPVFGDTTDEFDEVFSLNLFEPTNALIADRRGLATINDNDLPPSVSIGNLSAPEGQSNKAFGLPVTLSQASGKLVSVTYSTADGTAAAGADYVSDLGTLSIPAGTPSGVVNVQVVGDSINEPDETFFVNLSNPFNATLAASQGLGTIVNDDTPKVQFGSGTFAAAEGGAAVIIVTRSGDTSGEAFVSYATADGTANARQDFTAALGRLRFGPGETSKTLRVIITDDRFDDDSESFAVTLSNPAGAALGAPANATVTIDDNDAADGPSPVGNTAFDTDFFVRQHYADFLSREPDAAGLQFWTNEIEQCGTNAQCREVKRINVSAAFFLSIEFQETGYLVYRTYKVAYGDTTSPNVAGTVPLLRLSEFLPDAQRIGLDVQVGVGNWAQQLEANKNAYMLEFVGRQRFKDAFPATMTPAQFVDRLNQNAGLVLSQEERDQLVAELAGASDATQGRASVLRKVAEDADMRRNEKNRAFVLMQYFGYLRRNPDDPQDTDFRGWRFWLDKLNQFGGNYVSAEMVKAFLDSDEYRKRFGQ